MVAPSRTMSASTFGAEMFGMPTRTTCGSASTPLLPLTIWSLIASMRRACRRTSVPASVRTTPVRLLAIRSAPIMDSSRRMCALTAGWVRSRRLAVLVKLPSSQIATNVRRRSVGILILPKIADAPSPAALLCGQLSCIALPLSLPLAAAGFSTAVPCPFTTLPARAYRTIAPGWLWRATRVREDSSEPVAPSIDQRHGRAGQDHNGTNGRGAEHRDQAPAQESAEDGAEQHHDRLGPAHHALDDEDRDRHRAHHARQQILQDVGLSDVLAAGDDEDRKVHDPGAAPEIGR